MSPPRGESRGDFPSADGGAERELKRSCARSGGRRRMLIAGCERLGNPCLQPLLSKACSPTNPRPARATRGTASPFGARGRRLNHGLGKLVAADGVELVQ